MSAAEIIEQIRALPPEEQAKVSDFVHALNAKSDETAVRHLDSDKAQRIADKIFTEHAELFRKLAE